MSIAVSLPELSNRFKGCEQNMTIVKSSINATEQGFEKHTLKRLYSKFGEMSEKDFTLKVVCPLFESLGYEVVDYYGGVNEIGKDVICWREDDFGDPELAVIQVKMFKLSANAASDKALAGVVNQLSQAVTEKVKGADGNKYIPSIVYFVTPYDIDARVLDSRFETFADLSARKSIKTLSGMKFVKSVVSKIPSVAKEILGCDFGIQQAICSSFGNEDLLSALNYYETVNIADIYSDLEFVFGELEDRFFVSEYRGNNRYVSVKKSRWSRFKELVKDLEGRLDCQFVVESIDDAERRYEEDVLQFKKDSESIKKLQFIQDYTVKRLVDNSVKIQLLCTSRLENSHQTNRALVFDYEALRSDIDSLTALASSEDDKAIESYRTRLKNIYDRIIAGEEDLFANSEKWMPVRTVFDSVEKITNTLVTKKTLEQKIEQPKYRLKIDGEAIAECLNRAQKYIVDKVEGINRSKKTHDLKELLELVHNISFSTDVLFKRKEFSTVLYELRGRGTYNPRLKISIHEVFKSKVDVLVLGNAGAGKTTSLQMYAHNKAKNNLSSEICLYAPLARVFSRFSSNNDNIKCSDFLFNLAEYYKACGSSINKKDIENVIREKECTLLLDGVDEVVKKYNGILNLIKDLKNKYSDLHVVVSSRPGEYVSKIRLLGVNLLPFSEPQRNQFIISWFEKSDVDKSHQVIKHLANRQELSAIVRSPLLATILCVLAEHDAPLPINEIELYKERMRLLLGQYDVHKKIKRLKSTVNDLEYVSRKVAFTIHNLERRHLHQSEILQSLRLIATRLSSEKLELAVAELVDPCNVLMPMTEDGELGFGHLRYQEYLVACELMANRGQGVGKLLREPWWRGAMVLFSQSTDNIDFLANWVINHGHYADVLTTFREMVKVRPEEEQSRIVAKFSDQVVEVDIDATDEIDKIQAIKRTEFEYESNYDLT